jgi:ribosomal protein L16/L10AE
VHVYSADGEAKFWLEPTLELAKNYRLTKIQLETVEAIIQRHYDEFKAAWNSHFGD